MKRSKLINIIEDNLIGTEQVAIMLGVTKTRLNKIKELEAVVRGYYLKDDVLAYLDNEEIQLRRAKHQRKADHDN